MRRSHGSEQLYEKHGSYYRLGRGIAMLLDMLVAMPLRVDEHAVHHHGAVAIAD